MLRNNTHRFCVCALAAGVLCLAGCAIVDCAFVYHAGGRVVDGDTGEPLVGTRVAASREELGTLTPPDWPGWARSDGDGRFAADLVTGPAWGHSLLLGFILLGSKTGPVPPPLDTFFITAEDAQGTLHSYQVATPPGGQERFAPAERWLELDELSVDSLVDNQTDTKLPAPASCRRCAESAQPERPCTTSGLPRRRAACLSGVNCFRNNNL